ncbi:MAG: Glu/Leu/Phe/Val dehydrogenase dimerization domain-containing protein [Patescibacteria group bacterium]
MKCGIAVQRIYSPTELKQFPNYDNHEAVYEYTHPRADLSLFIAIHSTRLGPGLGGIRHAPLLHSSKTAALEDALCLSRAMSMKAAFAGIRLGGAKAVLYGDHELAKLNRRDIFNWVGECINSLGGRYITANDMGTTHYDLEFIREKTPYVRGLRTRTNIDYDFTSSMTAYGVVRAIEASVRFVCGEALEEGKRVYFVQGCAGHVGLSVSKMLSEKGCMVIGSDTKDKRAVREAFSAVGMPEDRSWIVDPDCYEYACNVFVPCAGGGILNDSTIPKLDIRCRIVCGSANNQLARKGDALNLLARGKLYVPDFVANAGGLIAVAYENEDEKMIRTRVSLMYEGVMNLLCRAKEADELPVEYAEKYALEQLKK